MNFSLPESDRVATVDLKARLVLSEEAGSGCRYIRVEADREIPRTCSGQFFMLRLSGVSDPLLGRPFSSIKVKGPYVDFVFRRVGRGTSILASLPIGSRLDLRGPCGNGFPYLPQGKRLILVAGTLGIAPFLEIPARLGGAYEVESILGVPGIGWEDFVNWCRKINPAIRLVSDDGTIGRRGTAVDEAVSLYRQGDEIWSCGPNPMLENMGTLESAGCKKILVSLEKRMACGFGGCLGCSVQTRSGYRRVCADGPVFEWDEILWNDNEGQHAN